MRNFIILALAGFLLIGSCAQAQVSLAAPAAYPFSAESYHALTYDLNRDGVPDFVIAGGGANTAAVLLSTTGGYAAAQYYPTSGACGGAALGNANCDIYPDLFLADYGAGAVLVLPGQAGGTFGPAVSQGVSGSPQHVAIGDFNGDFRTDFVALDKANGLLSTRVHAAGNPCTVSYNAVASYATASGSLSAEYTVLADVNHDGRLDAVVENQASPSQRNVSVLLGTGTGTFAAATTYATGAGFPVDIAVTDLNGDTYPEAVLALADDNNLAVLPGLAAAPYLGVRVSYALPAQARALAVADYDGDNLPDLAAILSTGALVLLYGQAAGTLGAPKAARTLGAPDAHCQLLTADFNGDNRPDLALVSGGKVQVLLNSAAPLPVQLVSFTARRSGSAAVLDWATASEHNNLKFTVERSPDGQAWQTVATVAGHGTSAQGYRYTYTDQASEAGYYRLAQHDVDGATAYSPMCYLAALLLGPPLLYPNPSVGTFSLGEAARDVRVRDALGRAVPATLLPAGQVQLGQPQPGFYLVEWTAGDGLLQRAKVLIR